MVDGALKLLVDPFAAADAAQGPPDLHIHGCSTKRTEPSARARFTPLAWRLEAVVACAPSLTADIRSPPLGTTPLGPLGGMMWL